MGYDPFYSFILPEKKSFGKLHFLAENPILLCLVVPRTRDDDGKSDLKIDLFRKKMVCYI